MTLPEKEEELHIYTPEPPSLWQECKLHLTFVGWMLVAVLLFWTILSLFGYPA